MVNGDEDNINILESLNTESLLKTIRIFQAHLKLCCAWIKWK